MSKSRGKTAVLTVVLVVIVAGLAFFWLGDRGYGKVSPPTYEVAKAAYGACLAEDESRLQRIEQLLDDPSQIDPIPDHERRWLEKIIATARHGDWESAARSARRIMEDQVDY